MWTSTYYRDVRAGCFQQYIVVPQHTVLPIPTNLSFEQAACLGVGALTAAMTLWKWLDVPMRDQTTKDTEMSTGRSLGTETPQSLDSGYCSVTASIIEPDAGSWLLIWGGSAVTGQFATQIAARLGLRVITVCSARTAALSKLLGAEHVVVRDDRMAEDMVEEIRAVTGGRLSRVIDLVGPKTAALCLQACCPLTRDGEEGATSIRFAPLAMMGKDAIVPEHVKVETVEMKRFVLDEEAAMYARKLNELVGCSSIRLPDLQVLHGGLCQVERGLEILKRGTSGGKKMVVTLRGA